MKVPSYNDACLKFVLGVIAVDFNAINVKDGDTFFIMLERINNKSFGIEEGGEFLMIGFDPSSKDSNIFILKDMTDAGRSRLKNRSITSRSIAGCSVTLAMQARTKSIS